MLRIIRLTLMTATFLTLALVVVYFQMARPPVSKDALDGPPDIGGPFSLIDHNGKSCNSDDFKGKFMLVYFGYSYCPDACPMALQTITQSLKSLGKDRDSFSLIFITLDPKRDSIEQLKTYSENYDSNFFFLTGSQKSIDDAAKAYKAFAKEVKNSSTTEYLVDHSTLIYLMDRQGKIMTYFPHSIKPEQLSNSLIQVVAHEKKHPSQLSTISEKKE